MRIITLLLFSLLIGMCAKAQDQIIMKDGDTLMCKITSMDDKLIKFEYEGEGKVVSVALVENVKYNHDNYVVKPEIRLNSPERTGTIKFQLPGAGLMTAGGTLIALGSVVSLIGNLAAATGTLNNQGAFIGLAVGTGLTILTGGALIAAGATKSKRVDIKVYY